MKCVSKKQFDCMYLTKQNRDEFFEKNLNQTLIQYGNQ